MKTSMNSTESKMDSMPVPGTPPTNEVVDDSHDDLGYEVEPEEKVEVPPVAAPPVVEKTPEEEKDLSGYSKEPEVPPVAAPPVVEKTPEEMTEEEKAQKEISDSIKELGPGYDKKKVEKFAVENKLTKAQLDAYVKLTKEEDAEFAKQQETAKLTQRKAWKDELQADPEFGGENFDKNVASVNKLLNIMPNTKKVLTEKGSVLPPYIMRDFLSLAKALNPTTKFVGGEPPAPKEDDSNYLDDMYS